MRKLQVGDQFISDHGLRIWTVDAIGPTKVVYCSTVTGSVRAFKYSYVVGQIAKSEESRKKATRELLHG